MRQLAILAFFLTSSSILAQPGTEIYLFDLAVGESIQVSNPRNISKNVGYDNQPSFTFDSKSVLFASTRNEQTDIVQFDIETSKKKWLTNTPGSEYSPIQTPDKNQFSAILLEKSGRQLLWAYPINGGDGNILIPELVIGYHGWYDENTLFAFVLGNHPNDTSASNTFRKIDVESGEGKLIDVNIGRSIHRIPSTWQTSFIKKREEGWFLMSVEDEEWKHHLTQMPNSVEDMTWLSDGTAISSQNNKLVAWNPREDKGNWTEVADLDSYGLSGITRIAASPDMKYLAVVVTE